MAKYLLLYSGGGMPETEEETAQVMQAWGAWYESLGSAVVDPGYPIGPVAKHVGADGHVGDGAVSSPVTGYTILEAGSLDEAAKMAQSCPVLMGGAEISVFETFDVMM